MGKKLISLENYNQERKKLYVEKKVEGNGIACPKCGEELYDSSGNTILASIPPKKEVACTNKECSYTGCRVA